MDSFLFFLLTMAIAAAGGMIGYRLKLPAGVMLGAMIATAAFNLATQNAVFYTDLRVFVQLLAGAMIASRMNTEVLRGMRQLVLPIIILVGSMFALNLVFGSAMYFFSSLDATTALFAAAPGGASDMAIIAEDLGAHAPHVAMLQLSRIIFIYTSLPFILKRLAGPIQAHEATSARRQTASGIATSRSDSGNQNRQPTSHLLSLLAVSAVGGMLFRTVGITAGAIIGSMIAGTIYCVIRGEVAFPGRLRTCMQTVSGAFIGFRVEPNLIASLGDLVTPLVIMFIGTITFSFGIGFLIHKMTKLDLLTCILASSPGGRQEMSFLSEDLGADTPSVAVMQTTRMLCVIAFFPTLLTLITLWLG